MGAVDFTRAALVVAHPDDEVLWFSSILSKVARIVICYCAISPTSERAARRRQVIQGYPFDTVAFLDLTIPKRGTAEAGAAASAERSLLGDKLSVVLEGMTTVYTHNPWGEYGQGDHQRVHAVVEELGRTAGFGVYLSSYAARHQSAAFHRTLAQGIADIASFAICRRDLDGIIALYRANSCWTWTPRWKWPPREHFLRLGDGSSRSVPRVPLHLFGSEQKRIAEMRGLRYRIFPIRPREVFFSAAHDS